MAEFQVSIQTIARSVPRAPCWFGEVTLIASHLTRQKLLERINEQVHFARRRFGRYEVIDFLVVLFGYAISGQRTLEAFYERVHPFASPFIMAMFGRERLPARSTLSRFLAALDQAAEERLRQAEQETLPSHTEPPEYAKQAGVHSSDEGAARYWLRAQQQTSDKRNGAPSRAA